ncbi:MAG: nucleotidyltransferase domain-containing protein [Armatimonadota bacterium]|nr:nucleotidyltransferase domain-containing protein [Armatimonadota bacterium]
MPTLCYDTLEKLSDRPHFEEFRQTVEHIITERGKEIAFLVVFGSMAKGTWLPRSDYDLLIGLSQDDGKRLIDRIGEFQDLLHTDVDVFPYSKSEWQRMFREFHLLLLEALDSGVVLADDGSFAQMRAQFEQWLREGMLQRRERGWKRVTGVSPAGDE